MMVLFAGLTACGGASTLTFMVSTDITDPAKAIEVFQASERMMTRRLPAADVKDTQVKVVPSGSGAALMTITVPNAAGATIAKRILGEPFTFDIRIEGPKLPGAAEGETNWLPTGVDGSSLLWITPITNPNTQEIGVELQFAEEGRILLSAAFKGNADKSVGIFVRDLLVSKMTISADSVTDYIIITGIPSERVAQIFADDVNVGLHAQFTQTK
jgi:hypothetical protein